MACERKKLTAEIVKDIGIIHRYDEPRKYEIGNTGVTVDLQYQAWPSVIADENGVLYAFTSGRLWHIDPFGHTLMYKSYDNGMTWSEPIIANDTPMDDRDVGAVYLGNGKMLITYFRIAAQDLMADEQTVTTADGVVLKGTRPSTKDADGNYTFDYIRWQNRKYTTPEQVAAVFDYWSTMTEAELEGGCWSLLSEDYGKTWSAPRRTPVSSPHGPLLRKDGSLLYVGRGGYEGDGIYAAVSKDLGETWEYLATIHKNGTLLYCEPHAVELENGRLIVGIRVQGMSHNIGGNTYIGAGFSHDGEQIYGSQGTVFTIGDDLVPVHYDGEGQWQRNRTYYRIYQSISDDGGKTWTTPEMIKVEDPTGNLELTHGYPYGTPPHLLLLKSGEIVLTYSTREYDIGQRAIVSYDNGDTWDREIILCNKPYDPAPDGNGGRHYYHADIGYPATVATADGGLLSVYYQAYTGDRFCSFLYTKWFLK